MLRAPEPLRWMIALVVYAFCMPSVATAQSDLFLVVRASADDAAAARAYERALEARLEADGRGVLSIAAAVPFEPLDGSLRGAIEAYHDLRPADAAAALDDLLRAFEARGEGLEQAALVDALIHRALAALALADEPTANAAIDRALAIRPDFVPDATRFPPAVRRRVEAHRAVARTAPLSLTLAPADAVVTIDGAVVATDAPIVLGVGRHVLHVAAPRYASVAESFDVATAGSVRHVTLELDAFAVLRDPGPPETDPAQLRDAARMLGASLVLFDFVRRPTGFRLILEDAVFDASRTVDVAEGTSPSEAIDELYAPLSAVELPIGQASELRPRPSHRRRRRALVASGVAAAVALGLGLGFGLGSSRDLVGSFRRDVR